MQMIPTLASCSFDEIMDEGAPGQNFLMQLYVNKVSFLRPIRATRYSTLSHCRIAPLPRRLFDTPKSAA